MKEQTRMMVFAVLACVLGLSFFISAPKASYRFVPVGAYTTPDVYLDSLPFGVIVETDGSGWYRYSVNGRVMLAGSNKTTILLAAMAALTSGGTMLLREVIWDTGLTVDPDVQVIEYSQGATKYFSGEFWWNGQNRTDVIAYPQAPYRYLIFKDGSLYKAKNGLTGAISWSSTNVITLLNPSVLANNNTVEFSSGNFDVSSAAIILSNLNNVHIRGQGTSSKLFTTANHPVFSISGCNDTIIEDLYLYGDGDIAKTSQTGISAAGNCFNLKVINNRIENMGYDGIHTLYGVTNCIIAFNHVLNCVDDGINPGGGGVIGSNSTVIQGNICEGMGSSGIHISDDSSFTTCIGNIIKNCGEGISIYGSTHNVIEGNLIDSCTQGIVTITTGCSYLTIANNLIKNSGGIVVTSGADYSIISGNTLENINGYGINTSFSDQIVVKGNNIDGGASTTRGIYTISDDVVIESNIVKDVSAFGIVLSGDTPLRGICSSNIITGAMSADGIRVNMGEVLVDGNIVQGGVNGIFVTSYGSNTRVIGNMIKDVSTYGITSNAAGLVIMGNRIYQTTLGSAHGIYAGADTLIQSNSVYKANYGIMAQLDKCSIIGNFLSGCNRGIYTNGDMLVLDGNIIKSSVDFGIVLSSALKATVSNNMIDISIGIGIYCDSSDAIISSNRVTGSTSGWGIYVGAGDRVMVLNNNLYGLESPLSCVAGTKVKNNIGFVTENSFSSANTTATTCVVNHGLASTATYVWVSFSTSAITGYTWSSTTTQVTITPTGTLPSSWTCYVKAEYVP